MLSFMREQDRDSSLGTRRSTDTGHETPVTSDRSRATSDEKYVAIAARQKQVRKSTILLVGLFILGLLCLWFMIKKSAPPLSAVADSKGGEEDTQIEMAIARLTGVRSEMFNRMGEIVKKFYEFSDVQQVNVYELVKNPFELKGAIRESPLRDTEHVPLRLAPPRQVAREPTHGMQLLSIIQSDQGNCCMIDDRILYEGDSIRGFKVRQISDSTVSLQSGNVEVILKLSE